MAQSSIELFFPEPAPEAAPPDLDEDGEPRLPPLDYDENTENLVPLFEKHPKGLEALETIAETVLTAFKEDYDADEKRRKRIASDFAVLVGELKEKTWPFEKCANAHVPFSLENTMRLYSRLMQEIFGDWKNVFGVQPVGKDDQTVTDALSLHGNWQLRNEIPDFKRQMGRGLMLYLVAGEWICQSEYDTQLRMNRHETLTPDEFVLPSSYLSTFPDLSDCPRYARIRVTPKHKLQAMRERWSHIDDVLAAGYDSFEMPIQEEMSKIEGKEPDENLTKSYKLIQWDGWLDMPEYSSQRWCRVVLHEGSRKILFLTIMEEPDWRDLKRYERQLQELDAYREILAQYEAAEGRIQAGREAARAVMSQAEGELRDAPADAALATLQEAGPRPPAPSWLVTDDPFTEEPEPPIMRQICLNARSVCLENVTGTAGLGVGRILGDYNRAADTALSQYVDAATLNNCPGWLMNGTIKFPEGDPVFAPGKFIRVTSIDGSGIEKAVLPIRPGNANQQLLDLVSLMSGYSQAAAQAPEVLSGAPGKSGETFRGHASRVEQASKQLTTFAQQFCEGLKQVLINNAALNAVFLPEAQMLYVLNDKLGQWQDLAITRALYERDYRVEIMSDMAFTSEAQRISEADQLLALVGGVPALASNPRILYDAVKGALVARGEWGMVASLGTPPPPPEQFVGMPPEVPPPGAPNGP